MWVGIPPGARMFVCCECRVLSGRGLCEELITRPEESYRLWCVVVCVLETSWMRSPCPTVWRGGGASRATNRHIYFILGWFPIWCTKFLFIYLFIYNTFIKILYMFRALPCLSSRGLPRNCIYAASGIVTLCRWLSCAPVKKELFLNRCTVQPPAESDDTRGCI